MPASLADISTIRSKSNLTEISQKDGVRPGAHSGIAAGIAVKCAPPPIKVELGGEQTMSVRL
jgi:hypothetical protein